VLSADGTIADALSKAAFVLGPSDGLALVDSMAGAAAVIAYRKADGTTAVAVSRRLAGAYKPVREFATAGPP
jgi:thiamine biosynthesis lipoprotein ApbE